MNELLTKEDVENYHLPLPVSLIGKKLNYTMDLIIVNGVNRLFIIGLVMKEILNV